MLSVDDKDMIHTFYNCSIGSAEMLLGADMSKKSVLEKIDKSYLCMITGERAQATGHGLAVIPSEKCSQTDILFVKTKQVK